MRWIVAKYYANEDFITSDIRTFGNRILLI